MPATTVPRRRVGGGARLGQTVGMNIRPKLSGSPLLYTLVGVEGLGDGYQSFATSLWSDDRKVAAALKELVFLRTSVVNACPT